MRAMGQMKISGTAAAVFFLWTLPLFANDSETDSSSQTAPPALDKSVYTLFDPTPDSALRPLETDRPPKADTPYTVDAGHFQYETDVFNYAYTNYSGVKTYNYLTLDPVWKLGLTNFADFEVQFTGYQQIVQNNSFSGATVTRGSGFGDVYFKLKVNLIGNDKGDVTFAVIPYVKAPSDTPVISDRVVEGGMIAPLRLALNADYSIVVMSEFDALKKADSLSRYVSFANLINISGPIPGLNIKDLTATLEFYAEAGTDPHTPTIYTFDTALAYLITPTVQVDTGIDFGLNKAAPKIQPFVGLSQRF